MFCTRLSSSASFAPLIARMGQGSDRMPAQFGVELACMLEVASVGRKTTVYDSDRVVDVVANHNVMEDRVDPCSS